MDKNKIISAILCELKQCFNFSEYQKEIDRIEEVHY